MPHARSGVCTAGGGRHVRLVAREEGGSGRSPCTFATCTPACLARVTWAPKTDTCRMGEKCTDCHLCLQRRGLGGWGMAAL